MSGAMVAAGIGAAGAIGGAMISKKGASGGTTTQEKSPWEPALPWLQNQLVQGQVLQNQYQQNPFNAQQQQAYSNLFGDLDNFRSNVVPSLFNFANNAMSSGYQRQPLARPGMGGYGASGAAQNYSGGIPQQQFAQQAFKMPAAGNYGLLNFSPAVAAPSQSATPAIDDKTMVQMIKDELERQRKAAAEAAMFRSIGPDGGTG